MNDADVIVVGAGAAGLKAAQELVAKGRSVIVLEANDRVGGRLKAADLAGRRVDPGGQWIGVGHDVLLAEGERFGIMTYPQYESGKTVMQLLGKLTHFSGAVPRMPILSLLELFRIQKRWDREMKTVPAFSPWTAPRAKEWDGLTLESWIVKNVHTAAAREFAKLVPRGAWAAEARQVSYLWFLDALRSAGGLEYLMAVKGGALDRKFAGGMQQVAQRMADELGDRVVLGAPVQTIAQDDEGVRVITAKGEFRARFVIVATPPGSAARIAFEPHLPAIRDGLQQRMPMGAIIKVLVAYREPFWRRAGFSGQVATDDDILGIVMDDAPENGVATLLGFIEGRHAVEMSAAGKQARKEQVIASLVKFFGPEAADYIGYEDNDWMLEPYVHGYVASMPPGVMTRFGRALREPCGRIHWAGSESSTEWAGYIEGAVRSGIRAAGEVYQRHNE
ncbi:MAG TPA: FAD-dependent oxidoreductase [Rhizomicrobium sp.]|nr:FAD-dependent oxidoreductase [Rhizomicrobium sp.]